jgi:hypothetical protein
VDILLSGSQKLSITDNSPSLGREEYPKGDKNRHFIGFHFQRILENGEKQNQYWLMYSYSKKCVKWTLRLETYEHCQKNGGQRESTLEWLELELQLLEGKPMIRKTCYPFRKPKTLEIFTRKSDKSILMKVKSCINNQKTQITHATLQKFRIVCTVYGT